MSLLSSTIVMFKNSEVLSISLSFAVFLLKQLCRRAICSFWEGNWDYNEQFLVGVPRERKLFLGAASDAGACGTAFCDRRGGRGLDVRGDPLLVSNGFLCKSSFFVSNRVKKLPASLVAV